METVSLKNAKRILSAQLTAFRGVYVPSYFYLRRVHICYVIAAMIPLCILGCDSNALQYHNSLKTDMIELGKDVRKIQQYIEQASQKQLKIEKLKFRREIGLEKINQLAEAVASSRAWKIEAEAFEKHNQANRERQRSIVNKQEARSVGTYEGYEPYSVTYLTTYTTLLPEVRSNMLYFAGRENIRESVDKYSKEIDENLEIAEKKLGDYPGYTKESLEKLFNSKRNFVVDTLAIMHMPKDSDFE